MNCALAIDVNVYVFNIQAVASNASTAVNALNMSSFQNQNVLMASLRKLEAAAVVSSSMTTSPPAPPHHTAAAPTTHTVPSGVQSPVSAPSTPGTVEAWTDAHDTQLASLYQQKDAGTMGVRERWTLTNLEKLFKATHP